MVTQFFESFIGAFMMNDEKITSSRLNVSNLAINAYQNESILTVFYDLDSAFFLSC